MQVLESARVRTPFSATVMLAGVPILRQMLQGRCCVTEIAVETFLPSEKNPLARRCTDDDRYLDITTRGKEWLSAAFPLESKKRRCRCIQ
jgi:hypothetical protein